MGSYHKRKGSNFEITVAKELSLWWSDGARDDIFCRSITSGAWATVRSKGGKNTAFSSGDLSLLDPVGLPFAQLCAVEMKRGYTGATSVLSFIDGSQLLRNISIYKNFRKITNESKREGIKYPVLIFKRDRKKEVVVISEEFYNDIKEFRGGEYTPICVVIKNVPKFGNLYLLPLKGFLAYAKPDVIKSIWNKYYGNEGE